MIRNREADIVEWEGVPGMGGDRWRGSKVEVRIKT